MGSVSSEDVSERCGSYSPSADISESESSSSFYGRRFDAEGASSSANLSPRQLAAHFNLPATAQVMLPVIGGKDVAVWDHKRDLDLTGRVLARSLIHVILFRTIVALCFLFMRNV